MTHTPLINGVAYSWADINLQLLGKTVIGVTEITYDDDQEIVDNYGAGNNPTSRGYGQNKPTASLKMEAKEVERITAATPSGRLQDIPPFPIVVSYVNATNALVTHKLMNAQFKKNSRTAKPGDTNIEVELPLIISHIQWK